jgi:citrate lyase subunit beta/citryl-CoA lyase
MAKALDAGADAVILDLEDSVAPDNKQKARDHVAAFLAQSSSYNVPVFIRINPLITEMADMDLEAVLPYRPFGIVLPKAAGGASVIELNRRLLLRNNADAKILPIATETPASIFALGTFAAANSRLCGLTWGAEDLPAAIGGISREENGRFTPPYEMVRALSLFGAHAADVPAIETVYPVLKDEAGLAAYAARGHRDGFAGMLALHPVQIATINAAFTSTSGEIIWAQRVVESFAGGNGVIQVDGKMLDAPHLQRARAILAARDAHLSENNGRS